MATDWTESIAAFERDLNDWLARAIEPPTDPTPRPTEPILLRMFEERLKTLQTHLDRAESDAEQALAPLDDEIQALRHWLDTRNLAGGKWMERTARGES